MSSARAEELKERYEKELARSNAELAQFATVAAHDLKSPLQVISGFAGLLEQTQGELLDERGQEFLAFILRSATRMNVLIDELLAYAKVGAERRLHVPVPLDRMVGEVVVALEAEDRVGWVGGARNPPGGHRRSDAVPPRDPEPGGQRAQVRRRRDCAPDPGVGVEDGQRLVRRRRRQRDRHRGPARGHIFGMFQRLHRNDYEGTGIGLAICKRIVEQRGGSIWVEENPGGGSRFRFTIPDELGVPRLDDSHAAVRATRPRRTGRGRPPRLQPGPAAGRIPFCG